MHNILDPASTRARSPRNKMVDFIVKDSIGKGKGLFASKAFNKNETLFKFDGIKLIKQDIKNFAGPIAACYLQIGSELYLDLEGHASFFVNHSCNPNCLVKVAANTAFIIAHIPIKIGDELTFDYSTTSTEMPDTWSMNCNCSRFGCRKVISGFNTVSDDKKINLIEFGMVPKYVLNE